MEKEQYLPLVKAVQMGDSNAANTLFGEIYNDVYYFALKTVKEQNTAEDVTQEALIEIFNNINTLKDPVAFPAWCRQITYFQCTKHFRKKKDVILDETEDGGSIFDTLEEESEEFIPDEALDKKDFKQTVMEFIDTLSEEQRVAVIMYYFDELSIAQIAEIQGVSEGTVKSRLNYARKAIKQLVEDYEKKNGIKLHAIPFLPFFKWLLSFDKAATKASAAAIKSAAAAVGAKSGIAVAAASAATGVGAKIAALPIFVKIAASVVAAAIVGGAAFGIGSLVSNNTNENSGFQNEASANEPLNDEVPSEEGMIDENTYISDGVSYRKYQEATLEGNGNFYWSANPSGKDNKRTHITIVNEINGIKVGEIADGFGASYPNLKSVTIDMDSAKEYADRAFDDCLKLEKVKITKNVKEFFLDFSNIKSLKTVEIEDGNQIEYFAADCFSNTAFYENTANWSNKALILKNVLLAADVEGADEFEIPEGVTCIAANAFSSYARYGKIILPSTLVNNVENANIRCDEVIISAQNPKYYVHNSYIINRQTKTLVWTFKTPGNDEIPSDGSVTTIGYNAFYYINYPRGNADITLNLPEGIEKIEFNFYLCNLKIAKLPKSLKYIGRDVFSNLPIVDFQLPAQIEEIGEGAFTNSGLEGELVIPKTLRVLPCDSDGNFLPVFAGNNFTSVTLEPGNPLFEGKDEQTVINQLLGNTR